MEKEPKKPEATIRIQVGNNGSGHQTQREEKEGRASGKRELGQDGDCAPGQTRPYQDPRKVYQEPRKFNQDLCKFYIVPNINNKNVDPLYNAPILPHANYTDIDLANDVADKVAKEAQVKVNNGKQGYNNRRHISKHEDDIIHFREDYNYQYNHNRKGADSFHNSHQVDIPIIIVDKRDGVANNGNRW